MSEFIADVNHLPAEQEAIRAKCFHPTGAFVEFKREEVEQSIPKRFEKVVRLHPQRLAIKSRDYVVEIKKPRNVRLLVLWMTALEEQRDVEIEYVRPRI